MRDAKPGQSTRIEWDDEVSGLGLRVTAKGVKAFILNYRIHGRERRMTLGRARVGIDGGDLTVAEARDRARKARIQIRDGDDPLEVRARRMQLPTMDWALTEFLEKRLPHRVAIGRMAPSTAREYRRQIEKYVRPALGRKRVADVTKADVEKMLSSLPPVMANRVCALVSAFFTWCEGHELEDKERLRPQHTNPARGIDKAVEEARDRTLSGDELSRLGQALSTVPGNSGAILAIRLAALTGLRIGEWQNAQWDDVDLQHGLLTLPKSKTGRRVHSLPGPAVALLAEAPRVGACVVPGRNPDCPLDYRAIQRHFARVCEVAEIQGVRLHDLRRTVMTEAAASGASSHLLRDMLGHKTTAMADRYIRRAGEPLTELRERMGVEMAAKMSGAPARETATRVSRRDD